MPDNEKKPSGGLRSKFGDGKFADYIKNRPQRTDRAGRRTAGMPPLELLMGEFLGGGLTGGRGGNGNGGSFAKKKKPKPPGLGKPPGDDDKPVVKPPIIKPPIGDKPVAKPPIIKPPIGDMPAGRPRSNSWPDIVAHYFPKGAGDYYSEGGLVRGGGKAQKGKGRGRIV